MTPCIPSTGQNLCQSSMPLFQEVSHHPPSSQDSLCPPSPTLSLSSAPMPAALVTIFLSMLLRVQSRRVSCHSPHTICILSLQIPIRVFLTLPRANNHLFPSTSTAELCPILSFLSASLQSCVDSLASVLFFFRLSFDFCLG